jgi:hypothetical protein
LCERKLEQRISKNGKPYFVCDSCGTQLFVRRKNGIEKLSKLIAELDSQQVYARTQSSEYLRILAILNEISATKTQIKKINESVFLFPNNEQEAAIRALKEHLKGLVSKLEVTAAKADSKRSHSK